MTEEQHELADGLVREISLELQNAVDVRLNGVDPRVEDEVRMLLTEQMRFWKRG